jgi:hypothetical protein
MKTAMQEMFSQLEIDQPQLFNINTSEGKAFVNDYHRFIELEKQQIIDTCDNAQRIDFYAKYYDAEQYYNETFKKQ